MIVLSPSITVMCRGRDWPDPNKQNRGCYRSSEMGIVAPRASGHEVSSRKTEIGARKEEGSISKGLTGQ